MKANYKMCKYCRIKWIGVDDGWCDITEAWATKGKSSRFQHPHICCPNSIVEHYYSKVLRKVNESMTAEERRTFKVLSLSTLNRFDLDIDDVPCWCPNI